MSSWTSLLSHKSLRTIVRGTLRYLFGRRGQRRVVGMRLYYRLRTMVMLHSAGQLSEFTRLPEARLYVDGPECFGRIEQLLRKARHTIVVQMFIWVDDDTGRRIAQALLEAADRGVQVEVIKEAVGDFFETAGDFLGTSQSRRDVWRRFWNHPRIRVTHATNRDHAKVYVIDDQILLLTGMNIADVYMHEYHDFLVELRGSRFVEQYLARRPSSGDDAVQLVMNTEESKNIRAMFLKLFAEARESIVIEHAYLSDPDILDEILRALRRGIRVTVIFPKSPDFHSYANTTSVGYLLSESHGLPLRILIYQHGMHAKAMLVDHDIAFVGSANLIRSSLDDMGEVNVLVRGKRRFLWKLQETLRNDILRCRALNSPPSFLWISRWLSWLGL